MGTKLCTLLTLSFGLAVLAYGAPPGTCATITDMSNTIYVIDNGNSDLCFPAFEEMSAKAPEKFCIRSGPDFQPLAMKYSFKEPGVSWYYVTSRKAKGEKPIVPPDIRQSGRSTLALRC